MTTLTKNADTQGMTPGTDTNADTSAARTRVAAILRNLPGELDGAGETVAGAARSVSASVAGATDDGVLVGASLSAGVALGILLGGGPRLLAFGAMIASVLLGASLLRRRPGLDHSTFNARAI